MAINNKPIFTGTPQINWCINASSSSTGITSASDSLYGLALNATGSVIQSGSNGWFTNAGAPGSATVNAYVAFIADATNGGYVQKIRFKAVGTTTTTVARVFINNGSVHTTAFNNTLFDEITLTGVSASLTAANTVYELPLNFALPPGYRVIVTLGTASTTNNGWDISCIGGSYTALP
jgi:hypothetical protein